jgi:S-DNA-T family DNA segregation ATPase FtsK/SpoIIIE
MITMGTITTIGWVASGLLLGGGSLGLIGGTRNPKNQLTKDLKEVFYQAQISVKRDGKETFPSIKEYRERGTNIHQFLIELPPGLGKTDLVNKKDKIANALKGEVHIMNYNGDILLEAVTGHLEEIIPFEEHMEELSYRKEDELSFVIGKTRKGLTRLDLAKFPHMLVGGQTGGGKSVMVRLLQTFLLKTHSPENLRLHLVDLKGGLEFSLFEGCPHIEQICTETSEVYTMLEEINNTLNERMELLRQAGVTNIAEYRALGNHLPFVVVVFDEFAELNPEEVPKKDPEKEMREKIHAKVSRLLRLARAVGIHIIIATQRPDAKALPGQLKANIPVTVAFPTRNKINSQILLDTDSASELDPILGRAILKTNNIEEQVQVMYCPPELTQELLLDIKEQKVSLVV